MTQHLHGTHVEGCFRCSLSRDEVTGLTNTTEREYLAFTNGWERGQEDLTDVLTDLQEPLQKAVDSRTTPHPVGTDEVQMVLSYVEDELG